MNRSAYVRFSAAVMVGLWVVVPAYGRDDLERRFREEAPAKWAEHARLVAGLSGTSSASFRRDDKPAVRAEIETRARDDARVVLLREPQGKRTPTEVVGYNRLYYFSLTRSDDTSGWRVRKLETWPDGRTPSDQRLAEVATVAHFDYLTAVCGESLSTLVGKQYFRVTGATRAGDGGLVRVQFDARHPFKPGPDFSPIQSGHLDLDPDQFWCLRAAKVELEHEDATSTSTVTTEVAQVAKAGRGLPVPVRTTDEREVRVKGGPQQRTKQEIALTLQAPDPPLPEADFTLSAFSLPEPVGVTWERPTRWWVYLTAAAVLGALAVVFRQLAARRSGTGPAGV